MSNAIKVVMIWFLSVISLHSAVIEIGLDGIIIAGKQRAQLNHMLGFYTQLSTNLFFHNPEEKLKRNILEYEEVLDAFKDKYNNKEIQESIESSEKIWVNVKMELLSVVDDTINNIKQIELNQKKVLSIFENMILLSKEMETIQKILTNEDLNKNITNELNAAIEIAYTSSSFSTCYLLKVWGVSSEIIEKQQSHSIENYTSSLNTLDNSSFSKGKIFKKQFAPIHKAYNFDSMMLMLSKSKVPAIILDKNEKAYIAAIVTAKLIIAASIEGLEKTINMH